MLERIHDLPEGIDGFEASGKLTRNDYLEVFEPVLEAARREGRQVRVLFRFGPDFDGYSAEGVWEDFRVGLRHLRRFEACAVVTDKEWIARGTRFSAPLMSFPVKLFSLDSTADAVEWLRSPQSEPATTHRFVPGKGVLVVEVHQALGSHDFDRIAAAIDPWIEANGFLRGLVVHAIHFPGWENLGAFLSHFRFVRDHHKEIRRVAVVTDGKVLQYIPRVIDPMTSASVRAFGNDSLDEAIEWAAGTVRESARA